MANTLGLYDPLFYAQEALIQLEKALGMASTVHRGYDKEPAQKGSKIKIRRPGVFTAQTMPITSANSSDITPDEVTIDVDNWFGVQFKLTDKELNYTQEDIISEHIRPAAVAMADKIDATLVALYLDIPWLQAVDGTTPIKDFTNVRQLMFDQKVPNRDRHMMVNGTAEATYLEQAVFHQANTAGQAGLAAQVEGFIGRKFGFDIFANQNVTTHTSGTGPRGGDLAGAVDEAGDRAIGDTTCVVDAFGTAETYLIGDTFVFASHSQRYVLTANTTMSSGAGTLTFAPPLKAAVLDDVVITFADAGATNLAQNMAYHTNAFALAMAPLSDIGNQLGAKVETAFDPITGLALRSTMWYEEALAAVHVRIDALWGVQTLDPNLAVRLNGPV